MSFDFTQFNKNARFEIPEGVDTYKKLSELYDTGNKSFLVKGFIKNTKGKYEPTYVAYASELNCFVNLPQHLTDVIDSILEQQEAVEAIKDEKLVLIIKEYVKDSKAHYTVDFENNYSDDELPFN